MNRPLVAGLGGSRRTGSRSLLALERALSIAESNGATTDLLDVNELDLPMFSPDATDRKNPAVARLFDAILPADAIIVCSPVYQECPSGAVKNALDYLHDLGADPQALKGRKAGLIAVGSGAGTSSCLGALYAACVSLGAKVSRIRVGISSTVLDEDGRIYDPVSDERLENMVLDLLDGVTALAV